MAQINKPNTQFNTKLYTGNGAVNAITGVNFQPDLVWIKSRASTGIYGHELYDSVRGVRKGLQTNTAGAEYTVPTKSFESFDADGFTVERVDNYGNGVNLSGQTHASWNWLAGGTAVSNTDGSITSSVSANTTSGFSIVTWTGTGANATVGTGLGSVPKMIILKNRDSAENWIVGNTSLGWTKYLSLNLTDSVSTASNIWQDTTPTSSVFSIGASGKVNGSGQTMVAYCFADVKGFSKVGGSYVGNGSADGTFVYTGFKPAMVIVKNTSLGTENWVMLDNKRDTKNPTNLALFPNLSNAESGTYPFDFISNGFKIRDSSAAYNRSGDTFIYMAFAENPLVGTNNIPATAR